MGGESAIASCTPARKERKKCENERWSDGQSSSARELLLSPHASKLFNVPSCHGQARKGKEAVNSKSSPTSIKSRRKKERLGRLHAHARSAPLHIDRDRTNTSPCRKHPSIPFSHHTFLPYPSEVDVIANKAGQLQSSKANSPFPASLSCLKAIFSSNCITPPP
jgi:hypothetical protein